MRELLQKNLRVRYFRTIMFVWMLILFGAVNAQTTIQIGTGTNKSKLPMDSYYYYNYSQSIYLKDEIATSGNIEKIYYNYTGSSYTEDEIVIYIGHTSKTSLSNWEAISSLTEVYRGPVEIASGWFEIVLDVPFTFNNSDNLIIAFEDNARTWKSSVDFYSHVSPNTNMSITNSQDGTNQDPSSPPSGNLKSYRPNIKFGFGLPPTDNDASINAIVSPIEEILAESKEVFVELKNIGSLDLTATTINWTVNGAAQTSKAWTGTLAQGATENVSLGTFDFSAGGAFEIAANSTLPNGVADENEANDTAFATVTALVPISTFPFAEDFENAGAIPDGWKSETTNYYNWEFITSSTNSGGPISADHTETGSYFAYYNSYWAVDGDIVKLTSPFLDVTSLSNPKLEFYYQRPNTGYTDKLQINVHSNNVWYYDVANQQGIDFTQSTTEWTKVGVDLTNYKAADLKVQFMVTSNSQRNFGLDDVKIYQPVDMTVAATNVIQTAGNIQLGANQQIVGIEIETTGELNPLTVSDFALSTNGTTDVANIDSATIYYTATEATFNTADTFGISVINPNGSFTITESTPLTLTEGKHYFWLVYDIADNAVASNVADAECSSITISGNTYTPTTTAPAGVMTIERKFNMLSGNNIFTGCDFTFYDDGGASEQYSTQFNGAVTIYPQNAGDRVIVDFTSYQSYSTGKLSIYNGNSTEAPSLLSSYSSATTTPGIFESSAADGSLTIQFINTSTYSRHSGWEASVSCFTPTAMTYVSATTAQETNGSVYLNTPNRKILYIQVETAGELTPLNVTNFNLNTTGTLNTNDISNARLWYTGNDSTFATTQQFGTDITAPNGAFEITGDLTLARGKNHFWLTYDVAPDAKGVMIDAQCTSITVAGEAKTPDVTAPSQWIIINKILALPSATDFSVTNCGYTLTDDGGPSGNYSNSFEGTIQMHPETAGDIVKFEFNEFQLNYSDYIKIWDGSKTDGLLLTSGYYGLAKGDTPEIYECSPGSFLTFEFKSNYSGNDIGWQGIVSCYTPQPMTYTETKVYQNQELVFTGETNQQVLVMNVKTANKLNPLEISSFMLSTTGTTDPADIQAARLYATGADSVFSATNLFGTEITTPNGDFVVSSTSSQVLLEGDNFFWLVYDMAENTTSGNVIDATCPNITVAGEVKTVGLPNPAGNREVIQKVLMPADGLSATYVTCNARFYDDGGAYGNYSNSTNSTVTFYPSSENSAVQIQFTQFDLYNSYDKINLYSGNSVNAPVIGKYYGGWTPSGIIKSLATDGSLTVEFISDGSSNDYGWEANVACYTPDDMQYTSSVYTQVQDTIPLNHFGNYKILGLEVVTSGVLNPLELTEIIFNTTGTNNASALTNAKVYYTAHNNAFTTDNQFGEVLTNPNGEFVIAGTQALQNGSNYFWLTYDLSNNATNGDTIDAACTGIKFGSFLTSPTEPADNTFGVVANFVAIIDGANTSATVCNTKFYDSGFGYRDYNSKEDGIVTVYPSSDESAVKIDFVTFNTEQYNDYLYIFDGNTVVENGEVAKLSGSQVPTSVVSSATDGSLTFKFTSDNSYLKNPGWEADLNCVSTVARLSDLQIDGTTIQGFDANVFDYSFNLRFAEAKPTVTYTVEHAAASNLHNVAADPVAGASSIEKVIVTAEDGITVYTYKIQFNRLNKYADANLTEIKIDGTAISGFDPAVLSYSHELPYGTTVVPTVGYTLSDSYASAQVNDASELPGATTINVTAEDGTLQTYTVNFTVAKNFDATLSSISVAGTALSEFVSDIYVYTYTLPYGTSTAPEVTASATDVNAQSVDITPATTVPGITTILVTAENGTNQLTYSVKFVLDGGSSDAALSNISKDGTTLTDFAADKFNYSFELPYGTTTVPTITFTKNDEKAIAVQTNATELPGATTIVVTSENGTVENTYTINFTVNAGSFDAALSDIKKDDVTLADFAADKFDYSIELPYGTTVVPTITFTKNDEKATVVQTNATELPGATTIVVTSENSTVENTYTINFTVNAGSSDAALSDIKKDDVILADFAADKFDYSIELPYGTSVVPTITFTKSDEKASVVQTDATELPGATTIVVTSENSTTVNTYSINFTVNPGSSDAALSDISKDGVTLVDFAVDKYVYSIEMPFGTSIVPTITFTKNDEKATVVQTDATEIPGATTIKVTSENGSVENTYTINFTEAAGGSDASLKAIYFDGTPYAGFAFDKFDYNVELPYGTTTLPVVTYDVNDANATHSKTDAIDVNGATFITVTSEDGSIVNNYTLNFTVAKNTVATLSDLTVDGTTLANFASDVYNYHVELAYGTNEVPTVAFVKTDANATAIKTDATELPGTTSVVVTSENGEVELTYSINFTVAKNNVATLTDLTVDGTTVDGFASDVYVYNVELAYGTTTVPVVAFAKTDANAAAVQTDATELPGSTTVVVSSENGLVELTYTINFTVVKNNIATLADLTVDGTTIEGFASDVYVYNVELAYGTTTVPVVAFAKTDVNSTAIQTDATELPGSTTVIVSSENGLVELTYTINFTVAKNNVATLTDLTVDGTTVEGFASDVYVYNVELAYGTTTVPVVAFAKTDANATAVQTDATELPGSTTVVVSSENGMVELTYTINFTVVKNNIATLADLTVDGTTIEGFASDVYNYNMELAYGTINVPVVAFAKSDVNAIAIQTDATELPGNTVIEITAEDGETTLVYTIEFTVAKNTENDILSFVFNGFDPVISATINQEDLSIYIEFPEGTDITALVPTIEVSDAAVVTPGSGEIQDFTNEVEYIVTAENGDEKIYKVNAKVVSVESFEGLEINLYPNPVSKFMHITISNNIELEKYCIYNSAGVQVMNNDLSGSSAKINLEQLKSGMYFIVLETSKETVTRSFIK